MKKEIAFGLGPIVKSHNLNLAIQEYAQERIEFHQREIETTKDIEEWRKSQGAIKELRRLLTLANEVEQTVKELKKEQ
jgi:hypothetical protein